MMRLRGTLLGLATTLALGACAAPEINLDQALGDFVEGVEDMLGGVDLPSQHLRTIRSLHEPGTWEFRKGVEEPLNGTLQAIRDLRTTDYGSWSEAALVVDVLSSICTDHPAALVRTEAIDTLAYIGPWTLDAVVVPAQLSSEQAVIDALKTLQVARGKDDSDRALAVQVGSAVDVIATYRFDEPAPVGERTTTRELSRTYNEQLRNARGVLLAFTGSTLEGFQADPLVREALDRGYVWVSASVIRLTLLRAALREESSSARGTAVAQLAQVRPEGAADALRLILRDDVDSGVRRAAVGSIARFELPTAVPTLIAALSDDMPAVRWAAARELDGITGQTFGDDRDAWIRWWAARSVGDAGEGAPISGTLGE